MEFCPHHVRSALENPDFAVRPEGKQVPESLCGTAVEKVFSSLVRMNDGPEHQSLKKAIVGAFKRVEQEEIERICVDVSEHFISAFHQPVRAKDITHFCYSLPICVIASLLGYSKKSWGAVISDVLDFVRCIAPGATATQTEKGAAATERLLTSIPKQSPLSTALYDEFMVHGIDHEKLNANVLGLFFQACEGTAGLIGQSLLLARGGALNRPLLLENVLLVSPPIRNTRRFVLRDIELNNHTFEKGDMVVLSLKNGNAFGHGLHACPGKNWAKIIADRGLSQLMEIPDIHTATQHYRWRVSQNAQVPEFYNPIEEEQR